MDKKDVQFCPRCGSVAIRIPDLKLGDPIETQGLAGWECLNCGYVGRDFFIVPKNEYEHIKKINFSDK